MSEEIKNAKEVGRLTRRLTEKLQIIGQAEDTIIKTRVEVTRLKEELKKYAKDTPSLQMAIKNLEMLGY